MTLWFTADQHFSHPRIIEYCNRPFRTVDEMDKRLIENYNTKVADEDDVYFIGDLTMKGPENKGYVERLVSKLRGRKYFVVGNHDRLRVWDYIDMGFITAASRIDWPHENVTLHHDPAIQHTLPKDRYLYCGHVHGLFKICKRVINVGVDVWDYFPVSSAQLYDLVYQEVVSKEQMGWLKENNYTE